MSPLTCECKKTVLALWLFWLLCCFVGLRMIEFVVDVVVVVVVVAAAVVVVVVAGVVVVVVDTQQ